MRAAILYALSALTKNSGLMYLLVNCNSSLHDSLLARVLRAPSAYYDRTPTGRILNVFSNDFGQLDLLLCSVTIDCIENPVYFATIAIKLMTLNAYFVIPQVVLVFSVIAFFNTMKFLQVRGKQLDLQFKSPVFGFFNTTISGLLPMRVYRQKELFTRTLFRHCESCLKANYFFWYVQRVFTFYIDLMCCLGTTVGIFIIVNFGLEREKIGTLGQELMYYMIIASQVPWASRQFIQLDVIMNSAQRILNMNGIEQEAPAECAADADLPAHFPQRGAIDYAAVEMRYRADLPPVLKSISFSIRGGEKIGVVGRTGAGKSSILQSLFRMQEISKGKISIDGFDIQQIGLHKLRDSISVIPQVKRKASEPRKKKLRKEKG